MSSSSGTGDGGMAAAPGGERFHLSESDLTTGAAASSSSAAASSAASTLPPILLRCPRPPSKPSDAAAAGDDIIMEGTEGQGKKKDDEEDDGEVTMRRKSPAVVLVVGMAGSGKTTLMAQLYRSLSQPATEAGGDAETPSSSGPPDRAADDSEGGEGDANADADSPMDEGDEGAREPASKSGGDQRKPVGYFLNLDPATRSVPFGASIDIRDTVDYREVMRQHRLGPNGAIVTSLNLFATKFDQVMGLLERRSFGDDNVGGGGGGGREGDDDGKPGLDYVVVDTPGQIEAFTWSASGSVFTEALASSFPTVVAFVVDTPRCAASPNTFMSNMLYACSVSFRTRLPLVVVFNKTDVVPCGFAEEWMTDYDSFQEALDDSAADSGYYGSLTRSLSLVLDEFYSTLRRCGVSAATGEGVAEFWRKVDEAAEEYYEEYVPDLWNRVEEQEAKKRAVARANLRRLERDMAEKANISGASVGEGKDR